MISHRVVPIISSLTLNEGAKPSAIWNAEKELGVLFPSDFVEFLLFSDGATGHINDNYLELWGVEEIPSVNRDVEINTNAPGLIAFGADGANELFAFDTRLSPMTVVQIPMIGMELSAIWKCADTFEDFILSLNS